MLDELIAMQPTATGVLAKIGEAYEELGEREQALRWLEEALEKGYALANINDNPTFEGLLADARFQQMLQRRQSETP